MKKQPRLNTAAARLLAYRQRKIETASGFEKIGLKLGLPTERVEAFTRWSIEQTSIEIALVEQWNVATKSFLQETVYPLLKRLPPEKLDELLDNTAHWETDHCDYRAMIEWARPHAVKKDEERKMLEAKAKATRSKMLRAEVQKQLDYIEKMIF